MKNILVTGAKGQVGSELQRLSNANYLIGFNFIFSDTEELDICDSSKVLDFFKHNKIAYCINCAAYTAVDKAESDLENALRVNVNGPENLARACNTYGARFLHISTDYVYHNSQNTPFKETDETNPQSVYGLTKLQGEQKAIEFCKETIVVRTSWVYSTFGNNFVKTMLKLGSERSELKVIFDQIGTPTYAADLAKAMLDMISIVESGKGPAWEGIFHYSNEGVCSWYDFAISIFEIKGLNVKVLPIETKDYPTPARRPHFSLLNKSKIKTDFGIVIAHWRESLKKCLELL
jgi:dTDP-4-dehydrorhamnose reductase